MVSSDQSVEQQAFSDSETNDEIDLKKLLVSVWNTRKFVVASVLLTAIILAGLISLLRLALPTEQIFQHRIAFAFEGSELGKYPNGSDFSINDLLSPVVLKQVYEDNKLADHRIKLGEFVAAVSVDPFSSGYDRIVTRYKARLSDRKLTFAERIEIEKNLQQELDSRRNQSALVRLALSGRVGISKELGKKVVRDIPARWADHAIEQRGVLSLVGGFESNTLVDVTLFSSLDYLLAIDLLRTSADRLEARIDDVEKIGGASTIGDSDSGHTLKSLRRAAQDLNTFKLQELLLIATEFVFTKTPERTTLFFKNKLEDLVQRQNTFTVKSESIRSVMQDYVNENRTVVSSGTAPAGTPSFGAGTTIAQYGDAFLDKIVNLTQKGSDQQFRQELTSSRLELMQEGIDLSTEIALTKQIMEKLTDSKRDFLKLPQAKIAANEKYVIESLPKIAADLNQLWQVSGKLQKVLSSKKLSYSGQIYTDAVITTSKSYISNHPVANRRVALLYLAALLVVAIFSMFAGLLWGVFRTKRADVF